MSRPWPYKVGRGLGTYNLLPSWPGTFLIITANYRPPPQYSLLTTKKHPFSHNYTHLNVFFKLIIVKKLLLVISQTCSNFFSLLQTFANLIKLSHTFSNFFKFSQTFSHFLTLFHTFSNFLTHSQTFSIFLKLSHTFSHFL